MTIREIIAARIPGAQVVANAQADAILGALYGAGFVVVPKRLNNYIASAIELATGTEQMWKDALEAAAYSDAHPNDEMSAPMETP